MRKFILYVTALTLCAAPTLARPTNEQVGATLLASMEVKDGQKTIADICQKAAEARKAGDTDYLTRFFAKSPVTDEAGKLVVLNACLYFGYGSIYGLERGAKILGK